MGEAGRQAGRAAQGAAAPQRPARPRGSLGLVRPRLSAPRSRPFRLRRRGDPALTLGAASAPSRRRLATSSPSTRARSTTACRSARRPGLGGWPISTRPSPRRPASGRSDARASNLARPALRDPALARASPGSSDCSRWTGPIPSRSSRPRPGPVPLFARFGSRPAPRRGPPPPGRCDAGGGAEETRAPRRTRRAVGGQPLPVPLRLWGGGGRRRTPTWASSASAWRAASSGRIRAGGRPRRRRAAPTRAT